jgi:hypothetical protein
VQKSAKGWLIYFDVKPRELNSLEPGSRFTVIYNPKETSAWHSVRVRVAEDGSYVVVADRQLEPHEIDHFERLVAQYETTFQA